MTINPYAACPCGSGKQFKWCCQPYYGYVEKALSQHERGQHAAATQTLEQLVQKFPTVPQAWGYHAQILFLNDQREAADASLQKAFDLDPNFAYGFWLRGLMRLDEGEAVGALMLFRKTAELLDPQAMDVQAQVHSRIAELELQANRPVAARAALVRARHFAPQVEELRQAFDSVFGPESRLPEAARKEYAFRPTTADLESAATGKLTDALKVLEQIAEAQSSDPAAWFNVALVRAWLGDNARALQALLRSIDLDSDEARAEEAGALAEVLRCGHGMEAESDFLEHRAYLQIRDPEAVGKAVNELGRAGRLVVINADRENGILSALFLEDTPDLGVGVSTPVARLLSYMVLDGEAVRFWHSSRPMLDQALSEFRGKVNVGLSEPQFEIGTAQFGDVVGEIMLFPTRPGADAEQVERKMQERARDFFEETWLRRPLKSLNGSTPLDAAAHPVAKKRLPGLIRFMSQCLAGASARPEGAEPTLLYDFDRLRRKLGLSAQPVASGKEIDFDTLSTAALGALTTDALSDDQLGEAFRAALKLDAPDLAAGFARHAVSRSSIADRWIYFNQLIRNARDEGQTAEVLRLLTEGEQADAESNEGRRRNDFALIRGQTLARSGDADGAYAAFREAISRSPNELRVYAPAAEAMLGRKQADRALEFAEQGLKVARAQNSRDGEQQFLELVAAARKQSG